ncbi:hypothetical protein ACF0H5_014878 [Mactra antiquata]
MEYISCCYGNRMTVMMKHFNGYHGNWLAVMFTLLAMSVQAGEYTLGMDNESICSNTHYYKEGDVYKASANGVVHDGHCPLTFIQSGSLSGGLQHDDPCLSLCVKIIGYTMKSCEVVMAYHDGLTDYYPVTFNCKKVPPAMWCSSKNSLKVTVSETKNYHGESYGITLEIKPFCGSIDQFTTDTSVYVEPQAAQNSMSQIAVIIGAVVGTISILFVLGWIMYTYKKRHNNDSSQTGNRQDRNVRGSTPNQPVNRYCPIERNPPSSQSSSDKGSRQPFRPDMERSQPSITNMAERRLYSPFQPPQPNRNPGQGPVQQVLYSDIDRGPQPGEKWYPMTNVGTTSQDTYQTPGFTSPTPSNQMSQYMLQNQVYKYPMDGEMHTAPTDTRYVVYDFDFESSPLERKYSAGKVLNTPNRQSPNREVDKLKKREITPLRETVRVMPPVDRRNLPVVDSTTTDHTSDNDSSMSGTTEDDTTDDQLPHARYNMIPAYGFVNPGSAPIRPTDSNNRQYDPRSFQQIEDPRNAGHIGQSDISGPSAQIDRTGAGSRMRFEPATIPHESFSKQEEKEGPVPQVPPMPKEFQRTDSKDLPWPHGPPPPYSAENKFVV